MPEFCWNLSETKRFHPNNRADNFPDAGGYEPIDRLKQLHERGLRLRVSDVALQEALAASVREYQRGMPLKRARGKFFGRAKAVAPYIDREKPIEVTSSPAIGEIRAHMDGVPLGPEDAAYIRRMNAFWPKIIGPGMHDQEWVVNGESALEFLDLRDKVLIGLGRLDNDIRTGKPPERYETWDSLNDEEQLTYLYDYVRATGRHSEGVAERLDASIRSFAWRLHVARKGARMPKDNDGADLALTQTIGQGCVLVTREKQLVTIVDECGTYQAPWVRHVDDLDDLPTGAPWGENAREVHRAFKRKK